MELKGAKEINLEAEDHKRYGKTCTGVLRDPEMAPAMKNLFLQEGIFTIRVTILGPNLCLLEDLVYGVVEIFIKERREWWQQWSKGISPWKTSDIDLERLVWITVTGVPFHARGIRLFKLLADSIGSFIKCDDHTLSKFRVNTTKVFIKTKQISLINEVCLVPIAGVSYSMYVVEECSPQQTSGRFSSFREEEGSEGLCSQEEDSMFEEEERRTDKELSKGSSSKEVSQK